MDKKRILFIEDEPEQVELIKIRLEASGYEFVSALDGEEGLKKVRQEKPDLILLDLLLPKVDGYTVCKAIKKGPQTKDIPIIVITAAGIKDLKEKCISIGADDCVIKPYDSADLLAKIKALLK